MFTKKLDASAPQDLKGHFDESLENKIKNVISSNISNDNLTGTINYFKERGIKCLKWHLL